MQRDAVTLQALRLERWCQTEHTRIADFTAGARLIDRLGIATLYPVSPEIPNLLHAYTGTPTTKPTSDWESASGDVYTWRWELGRMEAAFYTAIVRGRPTLVSWELLPAVLRLLGDQRSPDELHALGLLSTSAYRIATALEEAGGVLETGELRRAAGFPIGKQQRAAFLRAVAELDRRLLLAKVFSQGDQDMRHTLVSIRYPEHMARAVALPREDALRRLLTTYLPSAVYALPVPLAKHLGLPVEDVRAALEELVAAGELDTATVEGLGACFVPIGSQDR